MVGFNQRIICLLTDFGSKGQHYVASMKAVILKINPRITIIDLSHQITPYSIIEASYILKTTYNHFPEGTVFIIVVDPGVGGSREILAFKSTSNYYFIGPNNGIFSGTFINIISECVEIQNDEFFQNPTSNTFHGRDIMAPIGAYLLSGIPLTRFGPKFNPYNIIETPDVYKIDREKKSIQCIIQCIDSFGNGTTNIPIMNNRVANSELVLKENTKIKIIIKEKRYEGQIASHFSNVPIKSLLLLVGSTGFLEISLNQGNASKKLSFNVGDTITINF
ncbi:MAG: S-adenosyl-l-methionine hydroxide adenosyltransferase family protein [Candidatus Odinarchaeota archaeon]